MSGRDVILTLKVENDPSNKNAFSHFQNEIQRLKKSLDDALSGRGRGGSGGGGSGGGPRSGGSGGPNDDLKERIKLAGQLLNQQIKDDAKLRAAQLREKKRQIAEDLRLAQDRDRVEATNYINEHRRAIRERQKAERDAQRELNQELRNSYRQQRVHAAMERRQDAITNRILRGGAGIIGSVGGFIGGDTGSSLANVALGAHTAIQGFETGKGVVGAIGAARNPSLVAGSNAAVAAGAPVAAAGAAAILAWLPALAAAIRGATIAIKGSESTAKVFRGGRAFDLQSNGNLGSAFGEGIAGSSLNPYNWLQWGSSDEQLKASGIQSYAGLELSRRRLTSQQANNQRQAMARQYLLGQGQQLVGLSRTAGYDARRYGSLPSGPADIGTASGLASQFGFMKGGSSFFGSHALTGFREQFGEIQRGRIMSLRETEARTRENNFGREGLKGELQSALSAYGNAGGDTQAREQAEQRIVQARSALVSKAREEHQIAMDTARARLTSAQSEYQLRKQIADDARTGYESDLEKFAAASPAERARLRAISDKQKAGIGLSAGEIETARGYSSFSQFAKSQGIKRAEEAGAGDVFSAAKEENKRLQQEMDAAKSRVEKAQIELDNKYEIDINLKSDESFEQAFLKEFAPKLQEMDKAANDRYLKLRDEVNQIWRKLSGRAPIPGT